MTRFPEEAVVHHGAWGDGGIRCEVYVHTVRCWLSAVKGQFTQTTSTQAAPPAGSAGSLGGAFHQQSPVLMMWLLVWPSWKHATWVDKLSQLTNHPPGVISAARGQLSADTDGLLLPPSAAS